MNLKNRRNSNLRRPRNHSKIVIFKRTLWSRNFFRSQKFAKSFWKCHFRNLCRNLIGSLEMKKYISPGLPIKIKSRPLEQRLKLSTIQYVNNSVSDKNDVTSPFVKPIQSWNRQHIIKDIFMVPWILNSSIFGKKSDRDKK